MIALTTTAPPTLADLRARLAALYDQLKQAERAANGDIDPAWLAASHAVTVQCDAAEEAIRQASLALTSGDTRRAQSRLAVAWSKLQQGGATLDEWEADYGG